MSFHTETNKTINFTFGTNGKLMVLDVPILKDITITNYMYSEFLSNIFLIWTPYSLYNSLAILFTPKSTKMLLKTK